MTGYHAQTFLCHQGIIMSASLIHNQIIAKHISRKLWLYFVHYVTNATMLKEIRHLTLKFTWIDNYNTVNSEGYLTHWGRVMQIYVSKLTIIGSDNGLSPIQRQAIIWTHAGRLLIQTLGTNFSEILIQIHTFSNKKMRLKMSSGKWENVGHFVSASMCLGSEHMQTASK